MVNARTGRVRMVSIQVSKNINYYVLRLTFVIVSDKMAPKDGEFEVIKLNSEENCRTVMTQTPQSMREEKVKN